MDGNSARVEDLIKDIDDSIAELEKEIKIMKVMIRQKKQDLKKLHLMRSTQR